MIKTNIKMRVTPEQSRRVQEICFENDICWGKDIKIIQNTKNEFLYIYEKTIFYGDILEYFKESNNKEIDADLFIKTNGTCEETYTSKYGGTLPKDYNLALKKIENLHIALNKKVAKNKNQALEITKLLKQKKLLKKEISYKQNNDTGLINLLKEAQVTLDDLNKTIDLLEDRIKEKDTIISYLESKLK